MEIHSKNYSNLHEGNFSVVKPVVDTPVPRQENPKHNESPTKVSKEKLEKTVSDLNEFLDPLMTNLKFKIYEKTKEYYVQVVNAETSEVVKEIPSKKILDIHYEMEKFLGILLDKKI